jgi:hypothetical protein
MQARQTRHFTGIGFFTTMVTKPDENDWKKLVRITTTLCRDNSKIIKWYFDGAFAVHTDMKIHTGAVMTLGKGILNLVSTKQKVNSRSFTEAEFIAVNNIISKVLWVKLYMEEQDQEIRMNIIYLNNQRSMKMELTGKTSSGKRTMQFNMKYYYITDLIAGGLVNIEYCPTNEMIGDFMAKPIVGTKVNKFREQILGHLPIVGQQDCVGD